MHLFPFLKPFGAFWCPPPPLGAVWETAGRSLGDGWETAGRGLEGVWETSGSRLGKVWGTSGRRLGDVWAHTGGRSWRRRRAQMRRAVVVVGRGGAAGGVAPGSQRFPQEGSLQLSRVGASARQGRRSFLFTPIPKGGLLIYLKSGTSTTMSNGSSSGGMHFTKYGGGLSSGNDSSDHLLLSFVAFVSHLFTWVSFWHSQCLSFSSKCKGPF